MLKLDLCFLSVSLVIYFIFAAKVCPLFSLCLFLSFFTCIFYFDVMGTFSVSLFPPSLHPMFFLFSSLSLPPPLVFFHLFVSTHCFSLFFLLLFSYFHVSFSAILFSFFYLFFILIHPFPPSVFKMLPSFLLSCLYFFPLFSLCFPVFPKITFHPPFLPFRLFPSYSIPPPSSPHPPSISAVLRAAEEPRRLIILLQLHPLTARLHFTPRRQP